MTISDRIYDLLRSRNMSQTEFCKKTGIPQSTVCDWKRKKINPSADRILKICEVLEVSPYELLQDESGAGEARIDYRVVSAGTPGYDMLIEYEKLGDRQKERIMGFMCAMRSEDS